MAEIDAAERRGRDIMSLRLNEFLSPTPVNEDIEMLDGGWGEHHVTNQMVQEEEEGEEDQDQDRVRSHKLPIRSAESMNPHIFKDSLKYAVVSDRHQLDHSSSSSSEQEEEEEQQEEEETYSPRRSENLQKKISSLQQIQNIRENEFRVMSHSKESRNQDAIRALHGRNQRVLFDSIVETRIRLQPVLDKAFRLPRPDVLSNISSSDLLGPLNESQDTLKGLLHDLLDLRDATTNTTTRKRKKVDEITWQDDIDIFNTELLPFVTHVTDSWHRKAMLLTGDLSGKHSRKRLKALNRTPILQYQDTLQDEERLVTLAQTRPDKVSRLSIAETESDLVSATQYKRHRRFDDRGREIERRLSLDRSSRLRHDPEIYSDTRFYAAILKEFIESHGDADVSSVRTTRKKRGGRRKNVDRRATKGRKLKFVEHPKLLNFMTPTARPVVSLDVDRFFQSLFRS